MKFNRILSAILPALALVGTPSLCMAATDGIADTGIAHSSHHLNTYNNDGIFSHFDVGLQFGTAGLGIDVSTNITKYVRVRAGADWMPPFAVPMSFSIQSYTDGTIHSGNFATLQKYMKKLTNIDVDDKVEMDGKPAMAQFKLLADYYPVPELGFRVTAGFYAGKRRVAHALNTMGEMPSLLAVNIYNQFYDYFMETDFFETPIYGDIYLDPFLVEEVRTELEENGYMGIHVGDFKDGKPYIMHPDNEGMVKANMFVNAFRPYVGVGYTTPFKHNPRLIFDVDFGMMMWGGSPSIVTHEGVDLTTEVVNIKGRVGKYVRLAKRFKVYPMLNFRLSFRTF